MTNQYPHQIEMDAVLDKFKNMVNPSSNNKIDPFNVIYNYIDEYYIGMTNEFIDENFAVLSDLEEAAVLKNFGLWYQNKYRNIDPEGRARR